MGIIKKSIGITKTIKNASRFKEIVSVFAKNGFDEFIIKSKLNEKVPNFVLPESVKSRDPIKEGDYNFSKSLGRRLRISFEELGPSFIKIGQLLSTREDIFDKHFISELSVLRDQAIGIPFKESVAIIENSFKKETNKIFKEIDPIPVGRASIGVVYQATLLDDTEVVIKVRRPGIAKKITADLEIISFIVYQLEKVSEDLRYLGISRAVEDFGNNLMSELDFRIEALNCERLRDNVKALDKKGIFYIPYVYKEYVTEDVLVMEKLKGIPFSKISKDNKNLKKVQEKLISGVGTFVKTLLQDGFFHADLHGGNFFLLEDNNIGLIDFGLVGHLDKKNRSSLIVILYSLLNHNYENLVFEFLDVADYEQVPDVDELIRDIRDTLRPFVGLTVKQTNLTLLLSKITKALQTHKLYLPREWFIIFRALMTLDGVGKSLDIDLNAFELIEENLSDVAKDVISKENLLEEGILVGRDLVSAFRTAPRHLRWFLKDFSKNGYSFKLIHTGHEETFYGLKNALIFLGHCFLSGLFLIGGVLLLNGQTPKGFAEIPSITWIFWASCLVIFVKGSRSVSK